MLCEKCKQAVATTHIKQVINGVKTEYHLCNDCAASLNLISSDMAFGQMFSSLIDNTSQKSINGFRCEKCGTLFSQVLNTGKLGCAECYSSFGEKLTPYLKQIHGTATYKGKVINGTNKTLSLEKMKDELKSLISEERFEEAAVLRDRIREAEATL